MTEFFLRNIPEIYFFYGLSFFCMGLAVFLESGHSSGLDFAKALRPLAGFGLIHGSHEWFEMFLLLHPEIMNGPVSTWIGLLRVVLLGTSFLFLVAFGASLIAGPGHWKVKWGMMLAVIVFWAAGLVWVIYNETTWANRIVASDVYTRYALAIPGAALTVWGLVLQRRKFFEAGMRSFGDDVALAALAFGLYGGVGQLFATPSSIFPSGYLNTDVFMRWFGFPIQVFRAVMASFAALFIVRSLRSFEVENQAHIEALREAQQAESHRLEMMRGELLHRTVKAQESERQRIARELHDETGQTLTALGLGLRGLSENVTNNPQRAVQQAKQLETLAVSGIDELQRLVTGLHPPQLDDLGLIAALRWYANEIQKRLNLVTTVSGQGSDQELSEDVRTVFFRIGQEALTNIVRHANATRASIQFENDGKTVRLSIEDNGQGFDVEQTLISTASPHWGLLGMVERAALVQGDCQIVSRPGEGTRVEVHIQWEKIAHA